jgi:hypothetical protein
MDASEVTDTERDHPPLGRDLPPPAHDLPPPGHDLPPPAADSLPEESVDLTTTVIVRKLRRKAAVIMLVVWALIIVGEVGYVIGRDRTSSAPAAVRTDVGPGDLVVLQAIVQFQQDRLNALQSTAADAASALAKSQKALTDAQANPTGRVQIPLESFDPLGGAAVIMYSGTLALAECTGFGSASPCSADNHLAFSLAQAAGGTLSLSSALFVNAPVTRAGAVFHAQGPVANPTYAVSCNGATVATFFDAQLIPSQLTVTNGVPAVATFSVTFAITAPPGDPCTQQLQSTYQGTISQG